MGGKEAFKKNNVGLHWMDFQTGILYTKILDNKRIKIREIKNKMDNNCKKNVRKR